MNHHHDLKSVDKDLERMCVYDDPWRALMVSRVYGHFDCGAFVSSMKSVDEDDVLGALDDPYDELDVDDHVHSVTPRNRYHEDSSDSAEIRTY